MKRILCWSLMVLVALIPPVFAKPHRPPPSSTGSGSTIGTLTIAIIGQSYLDQTAFLSDAEAVSSYMMTYQPYASYSSQIVWKPVWNQRDLYCTRSSSMDRLLTCDASQVALVLSQTGVTYDKGIVLVNDSNYGGSGGSPFAVSYNGSLMRQVTTHEFGHTLGALLDEYLLYLGGTQDNLQHANCWGSATPPFPYTECNYGAWYRSTECSLMRSLSCEYFNPVSQTILKQAIEQALQH